MSLKDYQKLIKKRSKLHDQLNKIEEDIFLYTQVNKEDKDLDLNSHRQVTRLQEKIKQIDEEVSHILSKEYTNPQNNIEQDYIQLFDKLTNLKIKNYNQKITPYLIDLTSNILFMIYTIIIKLVKIFKHEYSKKTAYNLLWLIFKLTVIWIELIKLFSQSVLGNIILLFTFCSFYSTSYGYNCTNIFLDFLSIVFPNVGIITFKQGLINTWEFKNNAVNMFTTGFKQINDISVATSHASTQVMEVGRKLTQLNETIGKTVLTGIAAIAAQNIAQNINVEELLRKMESVTHANEKLQETVKTVLDKTIRLEEKADLTDAQFEKLMNLMENTLTQSIENSKKLDTLDDISTQLSYKQEDNKIIIDLIKQVLKNTEQLQEYLPDIEKLIKANQETNGELFKEITNAINKNGNIQTTITNVLLQNGLAPLAISKKFIQYFSEFTGIGMQNVLTPGTRLKYYDQPGGGTRKKTNKYTNKNRFKGNNTNKRLKRYKHLKKRK